MFNDIDAFMRPALVIQFLGVSLVRSAFAGPFQLGEAKGWKWKESPVYMLGGIPIGIGFVYSLFVYVISPDQPWMVLGLPDVVRWLGFAASLPVCAFLIWVFQTIGTAGSKHLVTFDDMKLTTSGPYSRVRHPMYAGVFLWGLTWLLFTDNWAVGGSLLVLVVFIAIFRVPHEEKVLIEHFGDKYLQYMARTNRFWPFRSKSDP